MVLVDSHRITLAPWYSRNQKEVLPFSYTRLSLSMVSLSRDILLKINFVTSRLACRLINWLLQHSYCTSDNLRVQITHHRNANQGSYSSYTTWVWALSFSFATTQEITYWFLFSQVLRGFTSLHTLQYSYEFTVWLLGLTLIRFPHSEIFGLTLVWQLPKAYRNLLRPSSVFYAKAFTVCP